jgi:hypothetical protein
VFALGAINKDMKIYNTSRTYSHPHGFNSFIKVASSVSGNSQYVNAPALWVKMNRRGQIFVADKSVKSNRNNVLDAYGEWMKPGNSNYAPLTFFLNHGGRQNADWNRF